MLGTVVLFALSVYDGSLNNTVFSGADPITPQFSGKWLLFSFSFFRGGGALSS